MRILLIIICLSSLTNCVSGAFSLPDSWNWGLRPRPFMMRGVPDGNDDYSLGFRDGCKSVLNTVAEGMVRNIKPVYDGWLLTSNNLYASGFVDGEEHCTYFYDWDIT